MVAKLCLQPGAYPGIHTTAKGTRLEGLFVPAANKLTLPAFYLASAEHRGKRATVSADEVEPGPYTEAIATLIAEHFVTDSSHDEIEVWVDHALVMRLHKLGGRYRLKGGVEMHIDTENKLTLTATQLVGRRIVVFGKSGAGKTHLLKVVSEEWLAAGLPIIIIDPMGQFRSLAKQYPIIIVGGGKRAQLDITPEKAGKLAEMIHDQRLSVILDVSTYEAPLDMLILEAFLEALWAKLKPYDHEEPEDLPYLPPYMMVIDEASTFAPQNGKTPVSNLIYNFAKMGRHKQVATVVAAQRPSNLNKDFLTQINLYISLRVAFGVDTAVLRDQLPLPEKELNSMMRKLPVGGALVIGDSEYIGFDNDYLTIQVRDRGTASSGTTPVLVESGLKAIDEALLAQLRETLAAAPAPVRNNTELNNLRQQLTEKDDALAAANATIEQQAAQIAMLEQQVAELRLKSMQVGELKANVSQMTIAAPPVVGAVESGFMLAANRVAETGPVPAQIKLPIPVADEAAAESYRSSRAFAIAQNRQRRGFERVLQSVAAMQPVGKRTLSYLMEFPDKFIDVSEIARRLDYSEERIMRACRLLYDLDLAMREDARHYACYVHEMLKEAFPDLDPRDCEEELLKLIEEDAR